MTSYELLEHTADTGFRVRAESLAGLFTAAAEALAQIVLDPSSAHPSNSIEVAAAGDDVEETLVNFLNEILYVLDGKRMAPAGIVVLEVKSSGVRAAFTGEPRDDAKHPPRLVVKAVTFHQLAVRNADDRWEAEVILDV